MEYVKDGQVCIAINIYYLSKGQKNFRTKFSRYHFLQKTHFEPSHQKTYLRPLGQKSKNNFVRFAEEMRTIKFNSEI